MKKSLVTLSFFLIVFISFAQPQYEFRGVWIATVANIDWPEKNEYNVEKQKADFIEQLDMHVANGMNAVIVQVRPATDAFYPSPYEPWSQWLTGKQGKAPFPFYDPLQFMIEESHKRGLEFHAWLNPYRANFSIGTASIAPDHVTKKHPDWFLNYGGKTYFDPGNKEGQQWVLNVIRDIVKRYNVDAIHMDDYFYPYKIAGKEFPDSKSYARDPRGLSKDDWRRSNVDTVISKIAQVISEEKPWVKFGISPFGVWRNQSDDPMGSNTKAGVTNYDDLYADILLWLEEGWIDYVAPQLYWETGHKLAAFETIVDCIYRALEKGASRVAWKDPDELPNQIKILRSNPNIHGSIYFSSRSFESNPNGWVDSLRNNYYSNQAEIPPMEWLPVNPNKATHPTGFTRPKAVMPNEKKDSGK